MKDRFVAPCETPHLWSLPETVETVGRGLGPLGEHVRTQSLNPLGIMINANVISLALIGSSAL